MSYRAKVDLIAANETIRALRESLSVVTAMLRYRDECHGGTDVSCRICDEAEALLRDPARRQTEEVAA